MFHVKQSYLCVISLSSVKKLVSYEVFGEITPLQVLNSAQIAGFMTILMFHVKQLFFWGVKYINNAYYVPKLEFDFQEAGLR